MFRLELYNSIADRLRDAGIEDHEAEAVILLCHYLHISRSDIFLHREAVVSAAQLLAVEKSLELRLRRAPLAYVLGEQEFWGRTFVVTPDVLIPRPETELLVEKAVAWARQRAGVLLPLRILDLGTGSGAISVTLALELPFSQIIAVDISSRALDVAARNALLHGVRESVCLVNADWYQFLRPQAHFDLVVSNPPYVARAVRDSLQPELAHEPEIALYGGQKGVEALERIFSGVADLIRPSGMILVEIGYDQKEYALSLAGNSGKFKNIVVHNDYAGMPRILQAQRKEAV